MAVVVALLASLGVTAAGLAPSAVAAPSPTAKPSGDASSSAEGAALALAQAFDEPIEVESMRSETQQVFAQPDGTLRAEMNLRPVRVHRPDGTWVQVDTSLQVRPDGTVSPGATVVDVALSGGGSAAPLATVSRLGKSLSLSWPGVLPAPVLDGNTATYAEVWPGVDLRVQVEAEGFSEQLVVKNREAAANPALATVRFGVATDGLELRADASGGLSAVDSAGGAVFRSPVPMMWDTAVPVAGRGLDDEGSAPDEPSVPGEHSAPLGVQVTPDALELTTDQSILTGADTVFPVVVDPPWTYGITAWTTVNEQSPGSSGWRTDPPRLAVGYQDFESPWSKVRTFMRYNLDSRIYGAQIRDATLRTFEEWSPSCTATAMEVWVTGGFSSSTTWSNQPSWGSHLANATVAKGHDSGCPAAGVEFNVTAGIAGAAKNRTGITFGMKATNEADHLGWKKFSTNPTVSVTYNRPPTTPSASTMATESPNTNCLTAKSSAPHVNVGLLTGIVLRVTPTDPDGDQVTVHFDFRKDFGTTPLAAPVSAPVTSGKPARAQVMKNTALVNGQMYAWQAYVQDSFGVNSARSAWCYFLQDSTAPSPPEVTSTDYPTDAYAGGAGQDGTFHFSPGDGNGTDIASYCFGMDQPAALSCVAAGADHTAHPRLAPPSYGPHDLWVRTKDAAGNSPDSIAYHFFANAATDAVGHWRLNETGGTTAAGFKEADPAATVVPLATLSGTGATWSTAGKIDGALHLNGLDSSASATDVHVATNASFSVTAWVKLTSKADYATVLSEDGTRNSGFYLQYSLSGDRWGMAMQTADSDTFSTIRAVSTASPQLNTWTHLAGVYDVDAHEIRLYVNGVFASKATNTAPWDAPGTLQIGRAKGRGALQNYWPGDIDEVRAYNRALKPEEIADIVNHDNAATPEAVWAFNETTGSTAADSSGKNHGATLTTGAAFTTDGHAGGGLLLDGTTGSAATAAPVIRTDKSFTIAAWVKLDRDDAAFTIASQDGQLISGFTLGYVPDDGGKWFFSMSPDDAPNGVVEFPAVVPGGNQIAGVWTHVAGTYDAFTRTLQIRVVDSTTHVAFGKQPRPWNASGALQVGRDRTVDENDALTYQDYFPGVVDDLRLYTGTLSEKDLRLLAGQ